MKSAELLVSGKGKPTQVNLRRAVSSTYYALFHCLARDSADLLVGGSGADRSKPAWAQVYRAVNHGQAKDACRNGQMIQKFPKKVEDFANLFVTMQKKRHSADYDPFERFTKSEVVQDIATVRSALAAFRTVPTKDRRAFCTYLLFKTR